ncbi:hypothetical protein OG800_50155 (plasmid) [Streptomyces sp. NBC_00445]|uniref:hypothetical protein n=1 Tax=Streptomyces sp. NBC_00445 TaxID=2975745 RepID=UPI002E20AB88
MNRLVDGGHLRTAEVIAALRDTWRKPVLPSIEPHSGSLDDALPTEQGETGRMMSCTSAPSIVATQREQMGAEPGHTILAPGDATGSII